jgi:hypothetical protein
MAYARMMKEEAEEEGVTVGLGAMVADGVEVEQDVNKTANRPGFRKDRDISLQGEIETL